MNRRELMAAGAAAAGIAGGAGALLASAQLRYVEGEHYQRLPEKVPTSGGGKIEVVEVFWYGCPHCFKFEPQIEAWIEHKPPNVEFVQVPGAGGRWTLGAVAYYTAKKLGLIEKTHAAMFDHIHVKRHKVNDLDAVADFYAGFGVDRATFDKAANSFEVKMNVQRAAELMKRYQVTGVPSLIVDGQFKTNSLAVVNFLISQHGA